MGLLNFESCHLMYQVDLIKGSIHRCTIDSEHKFSVFIMKSLVNCTYAGTFAAIPPTLTLKIIPIF